MWDKEEGEARAERSGPWKASGCETVVEKSHEGGIIDISEWAVPGPGQNRLRPDVKKDKQRLIAVLHGK